MTTMTLEPIKPANPDRPFPVLLETKLFSNIRYTVYLDNQNQVWVAVKTPDGIEDYHQLDDLIDIVEDICKG